MEKKEMKEYVSMSFWAGSGKSLNIGGNKGILRKRRNKMVEKCYVCGRMFNDNKASTLKPCHPFVRYLPKQYEPQKKQATKMVSRRVSHGVFECFEVLV